MQLYKIICYTLCSIAEKKLKIFRSQTKEYLTLLELGTVLNNMSNDFPGKYIPCSISHYCVVCVCTKTVNVACALCNVGPVQSKRQFPEKVLKLGEPNLLVTPAGK